nr:MAG TPA: hypothetical protein [Caudoviricetes sp.]DAT06647.1 MAG TPA: hypothetical protein [Caudoviricetes sp.]DAX95087.1 MAG TPA: hypothetical protein [Caudoviricetes sp.]
MEYIAVDTPHFVISLFIYTMLIIQNRSYTLGLLPM